MNLLEVCKKKKRWYLVFEFVDHTVLDDLELFPNGLDYQLVQKYLFQIINGIGFCHSHNVSISFKQFFKELKMFLNWYLFLSIPLSAKQAQALTTSYLSPCSASCFSSSALL